MEYICGSMCMCGGNSIKPGIAMLSLFPKNRKKETIYFLCQKQIQFLLGGGRGDACQYCHITENWMWQMPLQAGSSKLSLLVIGCNDIAGFWCKKRACSVSSLIFDICPVPSLTCCKINEAVKQSAQLPGVCLFQASALLRTLIWRKFNLSHLLFSTTIMP